CLERVFQDVAKKVPLPAQVLDWFEPCTGYRNACGTDTGRHYPAVCDNDPDFDTDLFLESLSQLFGCAEWIAWIEDSIPLWHIGSVDACIWCNRAVLYREQEARHSFDN